MQDEPRLRGTSGSQSGPWPIGQIPEHVVKRIGKRIVLQLALGKKDIPGDEFSEIFADAVDGIDYSSPLGLADVSFDNTGWSVKTVKAGRPFRQKKVRLISGRNSPDYSFGISDPRSDLQKTGGAVLSIWNSRLNAARREHNDVRIAVLIRNLETREFVIFEEEVTRFVTDEFKWGLNRNNNLQGYRKTDDKHLFTWQPHGGQFTVIRDVPGSAICFKIDREVPLVEASHVERWIEYSDEWIAIDDSSNRPE